MTFSTTAKYRNLTARELYTLLASFNNVGRWSFDYYQDTNKKNNSGICSTKALLLSLVPLTTAQQLGLLVINQ